MSEQKSNTDTLHMVKEFLSDLRPVEELFDAVLKQYSITDGVTIKVSKGHIRSFIDVEEFRKKD